MFQIPNFMQIRPVETELFLCGRTDMTKVIVSFRSFVTKDETLIYVQFLIRVSWWSSHKAVVQEVTQAW